MKKTSCKALKREHLLNPISVTHKHEPLNFEEAKSIAVRIAEEKCEDPMLLAWFDRERGKYSPPVECCDEEKPSWLVYAESRGADIVVDINDMQYVFVFHDLSPRETLHNRGG